MTRLAYLLCVSVIVLTASLTSYASDSPNLANRIEGRVYDPNRLPLADVDVELLNDVDSLLSHTKTTSAGRFTFSGLSSGRFRIRVLALRLNLQEQSQDVEIQNFTRSMNDTAYVDFYLRYDKSKISTQVVSSPDSIFVQETPPQAKELYEQGVANLTKNPEKGLSEIEESIKIFPTYFAALYTLGKEYIERKDYKKGYPYLLKAIDVNPRSAASYYTLGYAFLQLDELKAAVEAAKATITINASCIDCQLLYGTILRTNKDYVEAEKALLKAKSLSKKPIPEVNWQLALLYNRLNRNQDAANELEAYLKAQPDIPEKKKIQELIAKLRSSK